MDRKSVDLEKLRTELRQMSRGQLLRVVERAIQIVPQEALQALVGDMVRLSLTVESERGAAAVLEEVRKFYEASLRGEYFESFDVNGRNFRDHSKGTDAFIAEFDRLTDGCLKMVEEGSHETARKAFELLFALLRRADEPGAWQVHVHWDAVLPSYFRCLAEASSCEDFVREVDRVISDFCDYRRPQVLAAAQRVANPEQLAALVRLFSAHTSSVS